MSPGDEVVCVGTPCVCVCGDMGLVRGLDHPRYRDPVEGQHYVVGKVGMGMCDRCHTEIALMTPCGRERLGVPPPYAWPQEWFRLLRYDEEEEESGDHVREPELVDA